jgi:hypothetical protein
MGCCGKFPEERPLHPAARVRARTPWGKRASALDAGRAGCLARQTGHAVESRTLKIRYALQQLGGIWVLGALQYVARAPALHHSTSIHHDDSVGESGHDTQIVTDENDGHTRFLTHGAK